MMPFWSQWPVETLKLMLAIWGPVWTNYCEKHSQEGQKCTASLRWALLVMHYFSNAVLTTQHSRYWITWASTLKMQNVFQLNKTPKRTALLSFCQVRDRLKLYLYRTLSVSDSISKLYICLCIYNTWMTHAVDRWRVALKGETPDYINATTVHVSNWVYYIL